MSRKPRDRAAERAAIQAATERLLAGLPLRSASGKLTATELITESGLRRDVLYEHRDLVNSFKAQARTRHNVPDSMQELTDRNATLSQTLAATKADLAHERAVSAHLRRVVAELSIELEQARQEDQAHATVTRLGPRRAPRYLTHPG